MQTPSYNQLLVVHRLKDKAGHGLDDASTAQLCAQGLMIDTCLRQLWILPASTAAHDNMTDASVELLRGTAAYSFLLQTMTGLNSSVPGETNVQGQFRCSWKRWQHTAPAQQLFQTNQLMQQLLVHAGQIRRLYLENTGGNSYGSLARKLLRPPADARILFVGSGKFSRSMLPFFADWQAGLWNHRLHPELSVDADIRLFTPAEQATAARWASTIVLTTPADESHDREWLTLIEQHDISRVLHLGRRQAEPGVWANLNPTVGYATLDDVFALRRHQSSLRDLNVMRARRACAKLAQPSSTGAARLPETLSQQA